jgi:hypothetical protein
MAQLKPGLELVVLSHVPDERVELVELAPPVVGRPRANRAGKAAAEVAVEVRGDLMAAGVRVVQRRYQRGDARAGVGIVRLDREADLGGAQRMARRRIAQGLIAREQVHAAQEEGEARLQPLTGIDPEANLLGVAGAVEGDHHELRRTAIRARHGEVADRDHDRQQHHRHVASLAGGRSRGA